MLHTLKPFFSIAVNVFLIVLGASVFVFIERDRSALPEPGIGVGDMLPSFATVAPSGGPLVIVAVRSGCVFAERSMPFYRRVEALRAAGHVSGRILMVSPDSDAVTAMLLRINGVSLPFKGSVPLRSIGLAATPAVVQLTRDGMVSAMWEGQLSARAETEVLAALGVPEELRVREEAGPAGGAGSNSKRR